jgi:hypothetical protein
MAPIPVTDRTRDGRPVPGNENISVHPNQDTTCFTIMDDGSTHGDHEASSIHICNGPQLIATILGMLEDRAEDAVSYYFELLVRERGR